MNYKADTEYDLMYIDNKFNEHNYTLKPDEDMNTPQVIMELQANCDDFFKLVEDDEKLQEDYINLDDVQSLQVKDKNVIAYEMDLYLDTDGDRYRLLKSYANMLDRKPSILWVGFSNEEVADLTPNLGEIDDNAKKFGYKYNMQVVTDNLDYNEITHKLNNITNDVAIGGNWLYVDDIHRIDKDDIRNKAVQNMLYENKKLNEGDVMMNINYDNLNNESKQIKTESKNTAEVVLDILMDMNNKELGDVLAELADDIENHWVDDENFKEEKEIYTEVAQSLRHAVIKLNDIKSISTESKQLKTESEEDLDGNITDIVNKYKQYDIEIEDTDGNTIMTFTIDELGSILKCNNCELADYDNNKFRIQQINTYMQENMQIKKEAVENNVRLGFKDIVEDVLQSATTDGTITEVTDELITKCVDALEDEDELYDLIIGIIYDTIENKEVKTEAKESVKEYTCIEDRQGGDWAVGRTMSAEEWGKTASYWADSDGWEDPEEPLLKNFKSEDACISFIDEIWEITIVPSTDPRAKEFINNNMQEFENKEVKTESVVDEITTEKLKAMDKREFKDWVINQYADMQKYITKYIIAREYGLTNTWGVFIYWKPLNNGRIPSTMYIPHPNDNNKETLDTIMKSIEFNKIEMKSLYVNSESKQVVVEAKLTDADKKLLVDWGETEACIAQVERALNKTKFTVANVEKDENGRTIIPDELNDKPISAEEARKILGDRNFISGLDRSAFHRTSARFNNDETKYVSFDSSKLFEESKQLKVESTANNEFKYQGYTFIPIGDIKSNQNVFDLFKLNADLNKIFNVDEDTYNHNEFYNIAPNYDLFRIKELDNILVIPTSNYIAEYIGDNNTYTTIDNIKNDSELKTVDAEGYTGTAEDKLIVDDIFSKKSYTDIARINGYSLTKYQLYNLANIYINTQNKNIRTKIEDLLTDINYHTECSELIDNPVKFKNSLL